MYTVPSVRLGYLDGLKCGTYDCVGYGLYADNVYLNGTIISNSGTIGGFKIDNNSLNNGTWGTDKSVLVCTGTNTAKAVGGSSAINGWCFTAGSKFGVTTNGDLYASNANISGIVTSENGKIGTGSSAPFRVDHDGTLTATNASITGTITSDNITATGGNIGGWVITSDDIQGSNTYDGTLYTIGLKNVATGGSSSFTISDQDFIYSDLTSNSETVRTIAIKPVGQIHLQGISTSGMPGYTILDNNGIQVSSLDQKLILFKSHLISNNPTSSTNSFYIYSPD